MRLFIGNWGLVDGERGEGLREWGEEGEERVGMDGMRG